MKFVLLGGTKGIGRAVGRLLVSKGHELFLIGREEPDLIRSARDIEVRANRPANSIKVGMCDLARPETFGRALDAAAAALGTVEGVIVTAGMFAPQDRLEDDLAFTARMLNANFTGTIVFCEEARKRLLAKGGGTLCVLSSVAGERGRKPVVLYGASKAGLTRYLEGLDHKFRDKGLVVVTVKPGFVKTSMTAGLPVPPFAGDPDGVAKLILRGIERRQPVVYAPRIWGLIMLVIRSLPRFVMRKIAF